MWSCVCRTRFTSTATGDVPMRIRPRAGSAGQEKVSVTTVRADHWRGAFDCTVVTFSSQGIHRRRINALAEVGCE